MNLRPLVIAVAVTAAMMPLAAVVRAADCCFGTTCPNITGCTKSLGGLSAWTCKRTCTSSGCSNGDGCCQFQTQGCMYSGTGCHTSSSQVVNVSWSDLTHCYSSGGGEVGCLGTSLSTCEP
jgi:hypothetical protein